jgi:hypothetical protein
MRSVRCFKAVLSVIAAEMKDGVAIILVVTLFFATGCAKHWVHPTKSDQQWQADYEECKTQADQAVRTTTVTSARSYSRISKAVIDGCLREKGWAPEN